MMKTAASFKNYRYFLIFLLITLGYLLLAFISNHFILTDEIYIRSYSGQLNLQSINTLLEVQNEYWWVSYILNPLVVLLKISFSTICISIGVVLSSLEFKFKTVFKTALLAEAVFIIAQAGYMINLSFHLDTLTLETAANYFPLSALSYFGTGNVVDWLQYPLQTLNLFQVAYIVVIAWLLSKEWKPDFMESLTVVVPSYVTGLILWLVFVTFLTLQIS